MSNRRLNKLKKKLEYAENAKEKYDKFFNFKLPCGICKTMTDLQWYNIHLKSKKCMKLQNLIYSDDEKNMKLQVIKDKIFFLKYGPDTLHLNENSKISDNELDILLELKDELNNN